MLNVRDVMTRDVLTVGPTTAIKAVARMLVEHRISGMPVVDEAGRVVGVVTEGDLIIKEHGVDSVERRPLARVIGDSKETRAQLTKIRALTAGEAMTSPAMTIAADASVAEAAATMSREHVSRLPVIEGEALVGVVSRADLVRAFVRADEQLAVAIREDILDRIMWLDPALFDIVVVNGHARIRGHVERRSEAEMIGRITSMVPGVVGVAAELTWEFDDRQVEAPERDLISPYRP
jgi:CBS domain-containing protein